VYSDYFTAAVRTDPNTKPGDAKGISFLLIPRTEGVSTRKMKMGGCWCAGTTLLAFNDVKVPVENLIGVENEVGKQNSTFLFLISFSLTRFFVIGLQVHHVEL
jgi:alkylation response protein AidB-like acyl-CoA dehydrogenase